MINFGSISVKALFKASKWNFLESYSTPSKSNITNLITDIYFKQGLVLLKDLNENFTNSTQREPFGSK
jgi:hypothetical protein